MKSNFFPAHGRIVVQHVVEVAQVGKPDPGFLHRGEDTLCAPLVERLAQIQRVRYRIEHRIRRDVALARMQCG